MYRILFNRIMKSLSRLNILAIKNSTIPNSYVEPETFLISVKSLMRLVLKLKKSYKNVGFWIIVKSPAEKLYVNRLIFRLDMVKRVRAENDLDKVIGFSKHSPRIVLVFNEEILNSLNTFLRKMIDKKNIFIFFVVIPKNQDLKGVNVIPNSIDTIEKILFFLILISKY